MSLFFGLAGSAGAQTSSAQVGSALTASPVTAGDEIDWVACTPEGAGPVLFVGPTYTPAPTDLGDYLCAVDVTDPTLVGTFGPVVPGLTGPGPTIDDTQPIEGRTLTVTPGTWDYGDSGVTISDVWEACGGVCDPVASGSSYTVTAADVGDTIEVVETATESGQSASASSTPTSAVPAPPVVTPPPVAVPSNKSAPTVAGSASLGGQLTAGTGSWSGSPSRYTYQWLRCAMNCVAIPGAVAATYQPVDADVGQPLAVEVTAANSGGSSAPKTSARTGTVTAASTVQIAASPARPLVNQGVDLVGVVTSSAVGTTPAGTVTFAANGAAIASCTGLPVSGSGETASASCTASFPVSSPSLSAAFTPAASSPLLASASATTSVAVQQDGSTTALDVSSEVTRGSATTFTASVAGAQNLTGPVLPSGTVSFSDHGKTIRGCDAVAISDGGATCTVRYARTGSQSVSARYGGDANFQGSASRAKTIRVLAVPKSHSRLKPKILGRVTATMQWTFHYTPSFTRILALVIHGAATGSKVTVRCAGRGCPFKSRVTQVAKVHRCAARRAHACPAPGTLDLEPGFRRHDLRIHARVVIMISRRRYVGKYYRFLVRARTQPAVRISCLAPGSSTPGKGCKSS